MRELLDSREQVSLSLVGSYSRWGLAGSASCSYFLPGSAHEYFSLFSRVLRL